jgi:hypothetical protein
VRIAHGAIALSDTESATAALELAERSVADHAVGAVNGSPV